MVRFDKRSYELAFEALSTFQHGEAEEAATVRAFEALQSVGVPKPEPARLPEMVLLTLAQEHADVALGPDERAIILAAIDRGSWPRVGFVSAKKAQVRALLA